MTIVGLYSSEDSYKRAYQQSLDSRFRRENKEIVVEYDDKQSTPYSKKVKGKNVIITPIADMGSIK